MLEGEKKGRREKNLDSRNPDTRSGGRPQDSAQSTPPFPTRPGDHHVEHSPAWLARERKVFLDTSSVLAASARAALVELLLPQLEANQATVLVSVRTIDFLQRGQSSADQQAGPCDKALQTLSELQVSGRLLAAEDPHPIPGDPHDTETLFTELFIAFQHQKGICLVTQNEALALRVLKNARLGALNDKDGRSTVKGVCAAYIDEGRFKNWVPRLMAGSGPASAMRSRVPIEAQIASGFKVVTDTSSLMLVDRQTGELRGPPFFTDRLLPSFAASKNRLIVPERVVRELEKHARSQDPDLRAHGQAGQSALAAFEERGLLVRGEDDLEVLGTGERFADPVFLKLAVRFQKEHALCFITQDTRLAEALIANRSAAHADRFLVTFITSRDGRLAHWEKKLADQRARAAEGGSQHLATSDSPDRNREQGRWPARRSNFDTAAPESYVDPRSAQTQTRRGRTDDLVRPFAIASAVQKLDDRPIPVARLPGQGDTVFGQRAGSLQLGAEIAAGGEGTLHHTSLDDTVCKIYHQHCLTATRRAKLDLMLSRTVRIKGVCWPTEIVTDSDGAFVGYLMPRAEGKILKTAVFAKPLLLRTFPHWTRAHLTELAITILRSIDQLHRLNIFIGDINPQNILVKDERNIFLVDADSFQVEGFPCPVGTETFTPAERQGQNYANFLRSRADELFAVTTLLFMILFPGKAPYSSQGGGEATENIRNKRFAYGRDADGRPPVGSWQFIWSHLHPGLKDDFSAVFANGERVSIDQMVTHLQRSLNDVRDGRRSDELFPDKPRQREGATVRARCDSCPPDKAEQDISVALAERLRDQGRQFRCAACSALRKIDRLESTRDVECALHLSPSCFGRSSVAISHLEHLKASNRAYWCKPCSEAQKAARANQRAQGHGGRRREGATTSSPCFVATATYRSHDAPQVVFLRRYRDNVLQRSALGRIAVAAYYCIGPWLAGCIETMPALRPLCRRLLDRLVDRIGAAHPKL
jgi:hypothetical protein